MPGAGPVLPGKLPTLPFSPGRVRRADQPWLTWTTAAGMARRVVLSRVWLTGQADRSRRVGRLPHRSRPIGHLSPSMVRRIGHRRIGTPYRSPLPARRSRLDGSVGLWVGHGCRAPVCRLETGVPRILRPRNRSRLRCGRRGDRSSASRSRRAAQGPTRGAPRDRSGGPAPVTDPTGGQLTDRSHPAPGDRPLVARSNAPRRGQEACVLARGSGLPLRPVRPRELGPAARESVMTDDRNPGIGHRSRAPAVTDPGGDRCRRDRFGIGHHPDRSRGGAGRGDGR